MAKDKDRQVFAISKVINGGGYDIYLAVTWWGGGVIFPDFELLNRLGVG